MKKIILCGILVVAFAATASAGCFTKMAKTYQTISISANPEVMTLVGNDIKTDITVTFPVKYFNAKAIVRITPVLRFEGGEVEGTPKMLQGEKVKNNYTAIATKTGGMYTQSVVFPWKEEYRNVSLVLKIEGKCKDTEEFEQAGYLDVAAGTNALQQDFDCAAAMATMPDNFQRITHKSAFVDLMYQKNSSNVSSSELSKEQIKAFQDFIKNNEKVDRVTLGAIEAKGFASPEGPEDNNEKLSKNRGASAKAAVSKTLRGSKAKYEVASYGEDWDGFKKIVQESDMADKALVLQVLEQYASASERDAQLRNMTAVFAELQREILPKLRRTQVSVTATVQGRTDEEIKAAVAKDLAQLDVEELLFAATMYDEPATKIEIYKSAADRFNDARAWNNLAVAYAVGGDWAGAEEALGKAAAGSSDDAIANNLALVALAGGDLTTASGKVPASGKATLGLIAAQQGKYAEAAGKLTGYNKAVAEVLNANMSGAKKALEGNESAEADYLRAVIAVREGDTAGAANFAKSAIGKDASLKQKAQTDINLRAIASQL